jgi:hypothetical protein
MRPRVQPFNQGILKPNGTLRPEISQPIQYNINFSSSSKSHEFLKNGGNVAEMPSQKKKKKSIVILGQIDQIEIFNNHSFHALLKVLFRIRNEAMKGKYS